MGLFDEAAYPHSGVIDFIPERVDAGTGTQTLRAVLSNPGQSLFADGMYGDGWNGVPGTVKGLFYGDASQFAAECVGVLTCFLFVFVSFYLFFKLVEVTMGNRVSAEVEIGGLDIPEMGALAYPDFVETVKAVIPP